MVNRDRTFSNFPYLVTVSFNHRGHGGHRDTQRNKDAGLIIIASLFFSCRRYEMCIFPCTLRTYGTL
jgi:hypothetical protein